WLRADILGEDRGRWRRTGGDRCKPQERGCRRGPNETHCAPRRGARGSRSRKDASDATSPVARGHVYHGPCQVRPDSIERVAPADVARSPRLRACHSSYRNSTVAAAGLPIMRRHTIEEGEFVPRARAAV